MNAEPMGANNEWVARVLTGWIVLPITILLIVGGLAVFIYSIAAGVAELNHPIWTLFVLGLVGVIVGIIMGLNVAFIVRYRDGVLGRLFILGVAAGFAELLADQWLVRVTAADGRNRGQFDEGQTAGRARATPFANAASCFTARPHAQRRKAQGQ